MSENIEIIKPLFGGVLIGSASLLLLAFNGRIAGISGILAGLLGPVRSADTGWRLAFVGGLLVGGTIMLFCVPTAFAGAPVRPLVLTALAGLMVGVGTRMGSGCTSGHGVCGMSRFSGRSTVATLTFMATGALSVLLVRFVLGA